MLFMVFALLATPAPRDMAPQNFIGLYVHQLAELETIRDRAEADLIIGDASDRVLECVGYAERADLELGAAINGLKNVRVTSQYAEASDAPEAIVAFYEQKRDLFRQMSGVCTAVASGPKPGVDYQALPAQIAKIRARMEFVDRGQLNASTLAFFTLLSATPDKFGKMSHLSITNEQKAALLSQIENSFGAKLDHYPMQPAVAAMAIYRDKLREFAASDQP